MLIEAQHHRLKTWPTYFDAVKRGEKTFEVRRNDRFYQAGDTVELVRLARDEFGAGYDQFSEPLFFTVGPVLQGAQFGIEAGHCAFSLLPLKAQGPNT